jgi:hypothetical protein
MDYMTKMDNRSVAQPTPSAPPKAKKVAKKKKGVGASTARESKDQNTRSKLLEALFQGPDNIASLASFSGQTVLEKSLGLLQQQMADSLKTVTVSLE